jgi:hypothetical protein
MNFLGRSPQDIARANERRAQERMKQESKEREKAAAHERRRLEMAEAAHAQLTRANEIYERYNTENIHYANVVILLGYGGFFALWSSLAGKMSRGLFGAAGLLMGVSLLIFLVFEVSKIGACSWAMQKAEKNNFDERLTLGHLNATLNKVDRWWLWAFIPAVVTGLSAGGIVLWAYCLNAMQGPWAS